MLYNILRTIRVNYDLLQKISIIPMISIQNRQIRQMLIVNTLHTQLSIKYQTILIDYYMDNSMNIENIYELIRIMYIS